MPPDLGDRPTDVTDPFRALPEKLRGERLKQVQRAWDDAHERAKVDAVTWARKVLRELQRAWLALPEEPR